MIEFMKAGGLPIWFVLLFGLVSLAAAGYYFRRPSRRAMAFIRDISAATLFATLAAVVSCLAAVMARVPANPDWARSPDLHLIVMTGIGESLTPAILGFALLTLVWFLTALGTRRRLGDEL